MAQLSKLEAAAQRFDASPNAGVTVTSFGE
jgi:hypothetical protein